MTYTITLETFSGSTKKINLASRGAVALLEVRRSYSATLYLRLMRYPRNFVSGRQYN